MYCNYSKEKFGSGLTFILPNWVYSVRDRLSTTIDPLTGITRDYLKDLDGEELWSKLCCLDRTVASRDRFWKSSEEEYLYEISTDEGETLKPEDARDSLPLGLKTEICMAGFVYDWMYVPSSDTKEKSGFFYLRNASDAHPDINILSKSLMDQFKDQGIDRLK